MKNIGLHFRFKDNISEIIEQALELNVPVFQCFFTDFIYKKHVQLNFNMITLFKDLSEKFKNFYAHGSYLINLADDRDHYILKRELELSKKLGFRYLILHPGAFKPSYQTLAQGIDCIVRNINNIIKYERDVILVLENTAFGGNVIGGDLGHFDSIFTRLDFPERAKFCVDTAHAYVYGYNLNNLSIQKPGNPDSFLQILKSSVIKDFIQLLHLNNTGQDLGSKMDNHSVLTEGKIALTNLKTFTQDALFSKIDIIIEMPEVSKELKKNILVEVDKWF